MTDMSDYAYLQCPSCGREGHFHRDRVDGLLARGLVSPDTLPQDTNTPCDCPQCSESVAITRAKSPVGRGL